MLKLSLIFESTAQPPHNERDWLVWWVLLLLLVADDERRRDAERNRCGRDIPALTKPLKPPSP